MYEFSCILCAASASCSVEVVLLDTARVLPLLCLLSVVLPVPLFVLLAAVASASGLVPR